jgi:hypothetical protein
MTQEREIEIPCWNYTYEALDVLDNLIAVEVDGEIVVPDVNDIQDN